MSLSRRLLLSSSAVVLLAGLTACAGAAMPSSEVPTDATATTAEPAAQPAGDPAATPPSAVDLTADTFAASLMKSQASLTSVSCQFGMTIATQGQQITATGAMRQAVDGSPELIMTMDVPGAGAIEERYVGGMFYVDLGAASGDKFVALDPGDPSLGLPSVPSAVDPARSVQDVAPAIVSVTKAGEPEQLDGVAAQDYEVVVDLTKVTGSTKDQLDAAFQSAAAAGLTIPSAVTYHYWVGSDGLVRKLSFDLADVATEMTFTGWGAPVDVTAPTPDQVVSLDSLGQQ